MRGLKIIPLFLAIIMLSYAGMLFVEANHDPVSIKWWHGRTTEPAALGLVVLTSALVGMAVSGLLCSVEMLALYVQNQSLRKKLAGRAQASDKGSASPLAAPLDAGKPEVSSLS